jgi:hypothetical protein
MINSPTVCNRDAANMMAMLETARVYMKYGFDYHIKDSSNVCRLRQLEYGLSSATGASGATLPVCYMCEQLFSFFEKLKVLLAGHVAEQSLTFVLSDCSEKAKLFLAHRLRVVNQQVAIAQVIQELRTECLSSNCCSRALVVMDFKMKQEPMYFREKTVEHYGKRGISWHGSMVQHFVYNPEEEEWSDERQYFDHIVDNDSKQDRESVMSMIEAVMLPTTA